MDILPGCSAILKNIADALMMKSFPNYCKSIFLSKMKLNQWLIFFSQLLSSKIKKFQDNSFEFSPNGIINGQIFYFACSLKRNGDLT